MQLCWDIRADYLLIWSSASESEVSDPFHSGIAQGVTPIEKKGSTI